LPTEKRSPEKIELEAKRFLELALEEPGVIQAVQAYEAAEQVYIRATPSFPAPSATTTTSASLSAADR